jgi:hypothetical protein
VFHSQARNRNAVLVYCLTFATNVSNTEDEADALIRHAGYTVVRRLSDMVALVPSCLPINCEVGEAFFYATFSLMTQVMATYGQGFIVSSKTVNHFTQATYMPEHRARKIAIVGCCWMTCVRAGGMSRENFYESDWIKQQRQQREEPTQPHRATVVIAHPDYQCPTAP